MVGFNRCESPRAPDATEITANVRFPESRRSECPYWDRAEWLLMAESRRSLTVNMHVLAFLGEL